jgi:hypothetical protein
VIRKSYAALRNLVTSLPNPNPNSDPNPNISGQVESESEKNGSDPHHCSLIASGAGPMKTRNDLMTHFGAGKGGSGLQNNGRTAVAFTF